MLSETGLIYVAFSGYGTLLSLIFEVELTERRLAQGLDLHSDRNPFITVRWMTELQKTDSLSLMVVGTPG
jgi:hypothetical protein